LFSPSVTKAASFLQSLAMRFVSANFACTKRVPVLSVFSNT
jgi:hypothetical protein